MPARAYRWGEDGMAGFADIEQRFCLALALWNGRDPILKERMFGLTGAEANHGEDVKEYWWYLDAVPSHAWNRWRYHYPQSAFPYEDLIVENGRRGKLDPEYELLDTGAFNDDRYWIVEVDYAKVDPTDILMVVRVTNAGPDAETLHVLPTAWFRSTWSWDIDAPSPVSGSEPTVSSPSTTRSWATWSCSPAEDPTERTRFRCSVKTTPTTHGSSAHQPRRRTPRTASTTTSSPVRPPSTPTSGGQGGGGTASASLRVPPRSCNSPSPARVRPEETPTPDEAQADNTLTQRRQEADDFYAELTPPTASPDEAVVMRQAFAGMLWSKQLFNYDVRRWLRGDPTQPMPPDNRRHGRNARWERPSKRSTSCPCRTSGSTRGS